MISDRISCSSCSSEALFFVSRVRWKMVKKGSKIYIYYYITSVSHIMLCVCSACTFCCHSVPEILLQSALCVLQFELLSTKREEKIRLPLWARNKICNNFNPYSPFCCLKGDKAGAVCKVSRGCDYTRSQQRWSITEKGKFLNWPHYKYMATVGTNIMMHVCIKVNGIHKSLNFPVIPRLWNWRPMRDPSMQKYFNVLFT